jgi:hypothetical protein
MQDAASLPMKLPPTTTIFVADVAFSLMDF